MRLYVFLTLAAAAFTPGYAFVAPGYLRHAGYAEKLAETATLDAFPRGFTALGGLARILRPNHWLGQLQAGRGLHVRRCDRSSCRFLLMSAADDLWAGDKSGWVLDEAHRGQKGRVRLGLQIQAAYNR